MSPDILFQLVVNGLFTGGIYALVAVGLVGVLATRTLTESMVYGVSPTDLLTLLGGVAFLLAVGVLASVLPARSPAAIARLTSAITSGPDRFEHRGHPAAVRL